MINAKEQKVKLLKWRPREILHEVSLLGTMLRTASRKAWWTGRRPELEQCGRVTEEISKRLTKSSPDDFLVHSCLTWSQGPKTFYLPVDLFLNLRCLQDKEIRHGWGINFWNEYKFLGKVPVESHPHSRESYWMLGLWKWREIERKVKNLGSITCQSQVSSQDNIFCKVIPSLESEINHIDPFY